MLRMRSVMRTSVRLQSKVAPTLTTPSSSLSKLASSPLAASRASSRSAGGVSALLSATNVTAIPLDITRVVTFTPSLAKAAAFSTTAAAPAAAAAAAPAAASLAPPVVAAAAEAPKVIGWRKLARAFGVLSPSQLLNDPAKTGFNRWSIVPAALATHISLGSIFAWSLFNQPLMTLHGVVAPAAADWELGSVMPVFSTTMACFGISSFALGRMGVFEKLGPRATGLIGSALFGTAFSMAAIATQTHSLPLLSVGYGVLAGVAVGSAYVNPISTLLKWFPDRKGVASAMAVMGFGGGGMVAAPMIETLLSKFRRAPTYVGKLGEVATVNQDGKLFVDISTLPDAIATAAASAPGVGTLREVVVASTSSLAKISAEMAATLQEGLYIVGTGSTGLPETFACLGAIYSTAILAAAFVFRLPPEGFNPALKTLAAATAATTPAPAAAAAAAAAAPAAPAAPAAAVVPKGHEYKAVGGNVTPAQTLKTAQFWLVWSGMALNSAGAYAIIGAGKTMLTDIYGGAYPAIVTSAFAATFVSIISAFNLGGRLGWGVIADSITTRKTFMWMWGLGIPMYLAMPGSAHLLQDMLPAIAALSDASTVVERAAAYAPLVMFYSSVMIAISTFGGSAAVSPAYMADLFGSKYVGAIHGQLLSFLVLSGYAGPLTCTIMREASLRDAISKLASAVDPAKFEAAFGAPLAQLDRLIETKTVTVSRLLEISPVGTADPTPFLYDNLLVTMASLQVLAFAASLAIRKVDPKHYEAAIAAAKAAAAKALPASAGAAAAAAGLTVDVKGEVKGEEKK